ncbi:MAG: HAMP domain-containing sensor histidine kinase [Thermodesulfobacteriota bacterium]
MFQLNLRQKMLGFFVLKLAFFISLGAFLYKDFGVFNEDVTILIRAIRLSNTCLEIRRYEKNFIMRSDLEDFLTAQKYINEAIEYLAFLQNDLSRPRPQLVGKIETKLQQYRSAFKALKDRCDICSEHEIKILNDSRELLRTMGRELIALSDEFVLFEQNKLSRFVQHFQIQLFFYLLLLGVFTIFTTVMIFKTLIRPLKMIEVAATTIAKNRFTPLPLPDKKDELHSVLRAFNKMVKELEEQQEQLFQAKKLSSIGTLASGTAHQLNNPLNNISTSCQIALSELADLKQGNCQFIEGLLKNIEQETHRASETVKGLLEFSRAQTFSIQPAFLDDVVERAVRLVSSDVPADISILKAIPEDLAVKVDIQKMTEALLNLLLNAIQAIPEPPGTITITATADSENKNAVITVEDTGTGIDENNIQKIFDPFYTTKNVGKGTGLGLAVVYGIIKKHNGAIRVESKVGQGTKFIITLPLAFDKPKSRES